MNRTRMCELPLLAAVTTGRLVATDCDLRRQQVLEAVLAQPVVERRPIDAERASRARDVAARSLDRRDDLLALALEQALGQRAGLVAQRRDRGRRRRLGDHRVAARAGAATAEVEVGGAELGAAGQ